MGGLSDTDGAAGDGPQRRARDELVPLGEDVTAPLTAADRASVASAASYYAFFLSYSADFASGAPNPPGSGYHWSLLRSRFSLSAPYKTRLLAAGEGRERRAPAPPGRS